MPVTISALTWNSGRPARTPSPGARPADSAIPRAQASWFAWVCAAIFRRAGGPAGVHERGQIASAGRADPGQVTRMAGRRPALPGTGPAGRARRAGRRDAGGAIRPQRDDRAHPGLAGDRGQPLPELGVRLRSGCDQHLRPGAPDQPGDPVRAERRADRGGDPGGLRGQGSGEQPGAVRPAQRDRVLALAHAEGGQAVGDPGDRAGQLGIRQARQRSMVRRVGDPLGRDSVRPGPRGFASSSYVDSGTAAAGMVMASSPRRCSAGAEVEVAVGAGDAGRDHVSVAQVTGVARLPPEEHLPLDCGRQQAGQLLHGLRRRLAARSRRGCR